MTISHVRSLCVRRLPRRICGTLHFFCLEAFVEWEDSNPIGDWGASDTGVPPVGDPGVLTPASSTSCSHSTKDEGGLISLTCSLSVLPPHPQLPPPLIQSSAECRDCASHKSQ
ncbi:hypothetical protein Scep_028041 [Stephania cephalantha]|uniref:Uncharacterized protein n=1 Tax=Stephania cephalantha TaxID=152367 RepID=A0AAP0EHJ4_9MAGN